MGETETHAGTDAPGAVGFDFPTPAREINVNERTGAGARTRTDPAARTTARPARPRPGFPRCGREGLLPVMSDTGT